MPNGADPRCQGAEYEKIKARKARFLEQKRAEAAAAHTPLGMLTRAWGVFGFILYYLLFLLLAYAPLLVLGFPWWVNILLLLAVVAIPYAGSLCELVLWVWAFLEVRQMDAGLLPALFYIGAVFFVLFKLIPRVVGIFSGE